MSALIFQSNLCMQFWNYVVNFVIHLMNCIITFLKNLSPFEKLYNEVFDLTQIHVFGRLCYMSTIIANRNKLDPHVKAKIFLSFKPITKVTLSVLVSVSMFLGMLSFMRINFLAHILLRKTILLWGFLYLFVLMIKLISLIISFKNLILYH